jgi:putative phage-type endonuclease
MNKNYIDTRGMSRLDWLKARQRGIGGSDAAALVLTASEYKWSRPKKVYESKITIPTDEPSSLACEVGHFLEPFVASKFTEATGFRVHNLNRIILNPELPYMFANIDRKLYGKNVGLEIKTTSVYNEHKFTEDEYPSNYYVQMQHYMAVTGWEKWYLAALIGNNRLVWYEVPRDEDGIQNIIEIEKKFWYEVVVPRNERELEESWA